MLPWKYLNSQKIFLGPFGDLSQIKNRPISKCLQQFTHLEIDVAIFVHVERAEHVVAELFGVARRKEHFVHVDELGGRQAAIGAILLWTRKKKCVCYIFMLSSSSIR